MAGWLVIAANWTRPPAHQSGLHAGASSDAAAAVVASAPSVAAAAADIPVTTSAIGVYVKPEVESVPESTARPEVPATDALTTSMTAGDNSAADEVRSRAKSTRCY